MHIILIFLTVLLFPVKENDVYYFKRVCSDTEQNIPLERQT